MFFKHNMSNIIRIQNIENYNQEIINGELVLTPKVRVINKATIQPVTSSASTPQSTSVPKLGTRLMRLYDKI